MTPSDKEKLEVCLNRGQARYEKGDVDGAIEDYTEALRLDPNSAEAYFNRGTAWQTKEDLDRAIADYTKAIQNAGKFSAAHVNRGFCWQRKEYHDLAIDDFNKALAINPTDSFAYHNRGVSWQQMEKYDLSIKDFNRAIELNPKDALSFYSRCGSWTFKGDYQRALQDVKQAIKIWPHFEIFQEMAVYLEERVDNERKFRALHLKAEEETRDKGTPSCGPYAECHFVAAAEEHIPLASWGFFNPMGPTFESLCLSKIPAERSFFIFLKVSNPFSSLSTVYGLMPDPPDPGLLKSTLEKIFAENGGDAPIFTDAPSFVVLPHEPIIDNPTLRALFYLAFKNADISDLEETCLRLEKYWCDPWKRSAEERDAGFEILEKVMVQLYGKKNDDTCHENTLVEHAGGESTSIDKAVFYRWWSLVTDREHVKTELSGFPDAWRGAIYFQGEAIENPLESTDVKEGLEFHQCLYRNYFQD